VIQPLGVRLRGRPASAAGVIALSLAVPATMSSGLAASSQSAGLASIRLPPLSRPPAETVAAPLALPAWRGSPTGWPG
jgi:hypothetical protein